MNILLIQAPLGRNEPLIFPLGPAYLAGSLDERYNVKGFDPNIYGADYHEPLERLIREFKPEAVGVSLRNIDSQMERDLFYYFIPFGELLSFLRQKVPSARIIVGGAGFSMFPERIMERCPQIDYGVYLEGEDVFPSLLNSLDDPQKTPRVYWRDSHSIYYSGFKPFEHNESFPEPRYDIFDFKAYKDFKGAVGVQTKRGCPHQCVYCVYPLLNGRRIRLRNPLSVVEEISELHDKHGISNFSFVDAVFNHPTDHAVKIMEELEKKSLPITWTGWFNEKNLDESTVKLAIRTGCREFSFSPDGFDDRTLNRLGKNIRETDIKKTISLMENIPEMQVSFNFFFNPPGQSIGTFIELIRFFLRCKLFLKSQVHGFLLTTIRVEPRTKLFAMALKDGGIDPTLDLLPEDYRGLKKLFYRNRSAFYLDWLFNIYKWTWKLKRRLTSNSPTGPETGNLKEEGAAAT